jgi:hypothetical protein
VTARKAVGVPPVPPYFICEVYFQRYLHLPFPFKSDRSLSRRKKIPKDPGKEDA